MSRFRSITAVLCVMSGLALWTASAGASPVDNYNDRSQSATAQDGNDQDLPSGAGRIIGSPDAGPDPQTPGDRGGWAQLMTLGVLTVAVGFIMWRVFRAARKAPGSRPVDPSA